MYSGLSRRDVEKFGYFVSEQVGQSEQSDSAVDCSSEVEHQWSRATHLQIVAGICIHSPVGRTWRSAPAIQRGDILGVICVSDFDGEAGEWASVGQLYTDGEYGGIDEIT